MKGEQLSDGFALEDLYHAYMPAVYEVAFSFVQNPTEAEDLVQDCFLSLARCKTRFRSQRQILGWLILTTAARSRKRCARTASQSFAALLPALRYLRDREGFSLSELATLLHLFHCQDLAD